MPDLTPAQKPAWPHTELLVLGQVGAARLTDNGDFIDDQTVNGDPVGTLHTSVG